MSVAADLLDTMEALFWQTAGDGVAAQIAFACALYDPLWLDPDQYSTDLELDDVLRVTRHVFPDIYTHAVQMIERESTYEDIDSYITGAYNDKLGYAALMTSDGIPFGVPIQMMGVDWYAWSAEEYRDEILNVWRIFGIEAGQNDIDEPDYQTVIQPLRAHFKAAGYLHLWQMMNWLFQLSGNTCVDFTDDQAAENGFEYLHWDHENLAFVQEIEEEAEEIIADAWVAINRINDDPTYRAIFTHNIRRVMHDDCSPDQLTWYEHYESGTKSRTALDIRRLRSRARLEEAQPGQQSRRVRGRPQASRTGVGRGSGIHERLHHARPAVSARAGRGARRRRLSQASSDRGMARRLGRRLARPTTGHGHDPQNEGSQIRLSHLRRQGASDESGRGDVRRAVA